MTEAENDEKQASLRAYYAIDDEKYRYENGQKKKRNKNLHLTAKKKRRK